MATDDHDVEALGDVEDGAASRVTRCYHVRYHTGHKLGGRIDHRKRRGEVLGDAPAETDVSALLLATEAGHHWLVELSPEVDVQLIPVTYDVEATFVDDRYQTILVTDKTVGRAAVQMVKGLHEQLPEAPVTPDSARAMMQAFLKDHFGDVERSGGAWSAELAFRAAAHVHDCIVSGVMPEREGVARSKTMTAAAGVAATPDERAE